MSTQKKKKATKTKDSSDTAVESTLPNIVEEVKTEIKEQIIPLENTQSHDEEIIPLENSQSHIEENQNSIEIEIKENINAIIEVSIPKNLIDIVKEEIIQKTHILNKEYIDILNSLVNKSPNLLFDIEKAMIEITKDGKIDSDDIPYLISIIQKLYEFMFNLKLEKMSTEKRGAICAEIIKFVVHVLIKERRIKVENGKQDIFLSQFNGLMDSCISLLSLQSNLLSRGCCSCFFSKK